jgi:hypothetical protein
VQDDAQNAENHIILPALMQPTFKYWSYVYHYGHLIPAPSGQLQMGDFIFTKLYQKHGKQWL